MPLPSLATVIQTLLPVPGLHHLLFRRRRHHHHRHFCLLRLFPLLQVTHHLMLGKNIAAEMPNRDLAACGVCVCVCVCVCVWLCCVCVCVRARVCVRTNICMRVYTHVRKQTCRGSTYLKAAVNLAPYPLPPTPYTLHPTPYTLHPSYILHLLWQNTSLGCKRRLSLASMTHCVWVLRARALDSVSSFSSTTSDRVCTQVYRYVSMLHIRYVCVQVCRYVSMYTIRLSQDCCRSECT